MAAVSAALPWLFAKKDIIISKLAKAITGKGAVAKGEEDIIVGTKAGGISGPAAEVYSEKQIIIDKKAEADAVLPAHAFAAKKIVPKKAAGLVAYMRAAAYYVSVVKMKIAAVLGTAAGPVITGQVKNIIGKTANAVAADSKIIKRDNEIAMNKAARGSAAAANDTSAARLVLMEKAAGANTAGVFNIGIKSSVGIGKTAVMATWIYPEVVDGALIIRQAYEVTQTGNVLEVI